MDERYDVDITENLWIPLPDGTRLAARMWRPRTAAPVPAVLEYIPYRKRDGTRGRDDPMHGFFAAAGYAVLRVDMRGSGDSDGLLHDEYLVEEQDDALDHLRVVERQPEGGQAAPVVTDDGEALHPEGVRRRPQPTRLRGLRVRPVVGGRPHPVQPAAAIVVARGGKRAARQLLGIESERRALRAVAPYGKRARDRLAFEVAAKAGQIVERLSGHGCALVRERDKFKQARPRCGAVPA